MEGNHGEKKEATIGHLIRNNTRITTIILGKNQRETRKVKT